MDGSLLTSFKCRTIPTYVDLFKVRHSDDQALLLFEDYLCYRALQDVLSLRTSRWEHLVQSGYSFHIRQYIISTLNSSLSVHQEYR